MASDTPSDVYRRLSSLERRTCWVCFATEEDDPFAKWVQPCRCKGTTKWVHNFCLQRWFDEKQRGNPTVQVFCPQCNTEYVIKYPALGPVLLLIDGGQKAVDKLCPVMTAGFVIVSLYWTAVSFGAVSVMQVTGPDRAWQIIMEKPDPMFVLVGLPTIPFALVLVEMFRWEDYLLKMWREQSKKWWILRKLFGSPSYEEATVVRTPLDSNTQMDFVHTTRVLCGALLMPTFATAFGNYLFGGMQSPLKRALVGGAVFIGLKGILQMYYKQQQYIRLARREIEDFHQDAATSI